MALGKLRQHIETEFQCKCRMLSFKWNIDMLMCRDDWVVGLGNMQCYEVDFKEPKICIDTVKYNAGMSLAKKWGGRNNVDLPFVLFVSFNKRDYRCNFTDKLLTHSAESPNIIEVPYQYFKEF